jgi:hypothetical protein
MINHGAGISHNERRNKERELLYVSVEEKWKIEREREEEFSK